MGKPRPTRASAPRRGLLDPLMRMFLAGDGARPRHRSGSAQSLRPAAHESYAFGGRLPTAGRTRKWSSRPAAGNRPTSCVTRCRSLTVRCPMHASSGSGDQHHVARVPAQRENLSRELRKNEHRLCRRSHRPFYAGQQSRARLEPSWGSSIRLPHRTRSCIRHSGAVSRRDGSASRCAQLRHHNRMLVFSVACASAGMQHDWSATRLRHGISPLPDLRGLHWPRHDASKSVACVSTSRCPRISTGWRERSNEKAGSSERASPGPTESFGPTVEARSLPRRLM